MARLLSDPDTVTNSEKVLERLGKTPVPKRVSEPQPLVEGRIQNFTCPGCQEVLSEVTTMNGRVQGWCGKSHTYIN